MARIIHRSEVYTEVSLSLFHEREVQAQISESRADVLFPGYFYVEFEGTIRTLDDSAKPDFVLIEKEYRRWYIGETEMYRHNLHRHVLRQVRVFRNGEYTDSHSLLIQQKKPSLYLAERVNNDETP